MIIHVIQDFLAAAAAKRIVQAVVLRAVHQVVIIRRQVMMEVGKSAVILLKIQSQLTIRQLVTPAAK